MKILFNKENVPHQEDELLNFQSCTCELTFQQESNKIVRSLIKYNKMNKKTNQMKQTN